MIDDPPPSPKRALIGLLVIAVAVGGVLFIMHQLRQATRLQDCVMSGRTNCAPIDGRAH